MSNERVSYDKKFEIMLERANEMNQEPAYSTFLQSKIKAYSTYVDAVVGITTDKIVARDKYEGEDLRRAFEDLNLTMTNKFDAIETSTRVLNAQCEVLKLPPFYEGPENPSRKALEQLAQDVTADIYDAREDYENAKTKQNETSKQVESDGLEV